MAPASISVDIMQQKLCVHIRPTATTPASTAAITQLTDSVTRVQVTNHKKFVKPFHTVILTSARTPATITALRCQRYAGVLQPTILYLPEKRVHYSVEFTHTILAIMIHYIVLCTIPRTASATPIVPSS